MSDVKTYHPNRAEKLGFKALTSSYQKSEETMMENAMANLRAGGIEHCLVKLPDGLEIWRRGYTPLNET